MTQDAKEAMKESIELTELLKVWGCGECRPNGEYEGMLHHLGFDWSEITNDFNTFLDNYTSLKGYIPLALFKDILGQLMWRVTDREDQKSFLRAVFGEVRNA
ncbi:hypothetical protein D3C81_1072740 [compost metagenome]